jgi:hypothetical protein
MFCLRREGEQEVLHLWCVHRDDVAICPRCGAVSENVHEEKAIRFVSIDMWAPSIIFP